MNSLGNLINKVDNYNRNRDKFDKEDDLLFGLITVLPGLGMGYCDSKAINTDPRMTIAVCSTPLIFFSGLGAFSLGVFSSEIVAYNTKTGRFTEKYTFKKTLTDCLKGARRGVNLAAPWTAAGYVVGRIGGYIF